MLKYRVLDADKKQFLTDNIVLTPTGKVLQNNVLIESVTAQPSLNIADKNGVDVFIGDALSLPITESNKKILLSHSSLDMQLNYIPEHADYDELIIQITNNDVGDMYYWVLFKKNGVFVKNKQCNLPEKLSTEGDGEEVRAIPTSSLSLLRKLCYIDPFEVIYNCTDDEWLDNL